VFSVYVVLIFIERKVNKNLDYVKVKLKLLYVG